ncbi:MAG: hypothetical protein R8J41_11080 [Alphaproteobacteria bacterium]|nr:hypothetical protein [Alphaproteobacteria bacterium]
MAKYSSVLTTEDDRAVKKLLAAQMMVTGYLTYAGASMEADGFLEKAGVSVFAIGSTAALMLFWRACWRIVPRLDSVSAQLAAALTISAGLAVTFNLSTVHNATYLSGGEGLELHLEAHIARQEVAGDAAQANANQIKGIAAALRVQSDDYAAKALSELTQGAYTGSPGKGAVYFALLGVKSRIDALLREVDRFLVEAEQAATRAQQSLIKMRDAKHGDHPYQDRVTHVSTLSDDLRRNAADLDPSNLGTMVEQTLASVPKELELYQQLSSNGQLARRQEAALIKLRGDTTATTSVLRSIAGDIAETGPVGFKPFERITPTQSLYMYWQSFVPAIMGGVALDLSPLFLLLFTTIWRVSKTREQMQAEMILGQSLEEVACGVVGSQFTRTVSMSPALQAVLWNSRFGAPNGPANDDTQAEGDR